MNERRVWPAALLLVVPLLTLGVPTAALAQNGRITAIARSGEAGGFTISDLAAGSYDVSVAHLGLRATASDVRVAAGASDLTQGHRCT